MDNKMDNFKSNSKRNTRRIICPLCTNTESFTSHKCLLEHLTDIHGIEIIKSHHNFQSMNDFMAWRSFQNREVDYACQSSRKVQNRIKYIIYKCNRSDEKGFVRSGIKRKIKTGGSIKMKGVCPSRIDVKVLKNDEISVDFIETHVGHEIEYRSRRFKKAEEKDIVDQLKAGVSESRILSEARKIDGNELTRRKFLTAQDLINLRRKHKITKRKDTDNMMDTALKVEDLDQQEEIDTFSPENSNSSYSSDRTNNLREEIYNKIDMLNEQGLHKLKMWISTLGAENFRNQNEGMICKEEEI